ncbi:MAG: DUF4160 domain-containing protein [Treponema sp.]|nr:DUF4160 domain-containing protein [Treponema sp.]MEE3434573.1 DUF4160 domain-containing protein [Treponema sp.]
MPKYFRDKIADHYLYFTSQCIVEAMHVHASDKHMTENDSAKFFVRADGSSLMQKRGDLSDSQISKIQKFIKANYLNMYKTWKDFGGGEFFKN